MAHIIALPPSNFSPFSNIQFYVSLTKVSTYRTMMMAVMTMRTNMISMIKTIMVLLIKTVFH
jgi:hypothetical protein